MVRLPAVICLFLILCGSALAAPAQKPDAPAVDPQAMTLLQKVQKAMLGLHSYQAECDTMLAFPAKDGKPAHESREVATLKAVRPNRMRYDQQSLKQDAAMGKWTPDTKDPGIIFTCDGKTDWKQFGGSYRTDKDTQPQFLHTVLEPWGGFFSAADSPCGWVQGEQKQGGLLELRRDGQENVNGVLCDKVFDHLRVKFGEQTQEYWETWYIGSDGLVRRHVQRLEFDGKPGFTRDAVIRNIQINGPILAKTFTYSPPQGVQLETARKETPLLVAGTPAPDFTATDKDGKAVQLSELRGKVVVVDFWASWCPPCRASMPHSQEVTKKLQDEGQPVMLLAVDNSEDRDAFTKWVGENDTTLSALTFVHIPPATNVAGKLYQVTGIPTQYVLDKSGIIRASFVGYGGPTGDLEAAVRAALKQP